MKPQIAIGSDHAGYPEKELVKKHLEKRGITFIDLGTNSSESVDYPIFGELVGKAVAKGEAKQGIILCGTGIGIMIAANKVNGIRAAVAWNEETARLSRQHNDANILSIGARMIAPDEIIAIVDSYLDSEFEGGRHQRRIDEITAIETVKDSNCVAG